MGVVQKEDGTYTLLFDFWSGGFGLMEKVGEGCTLLLEEYKQQVVQQVCESHGWMCVKQENGDTLVYPSGGGAVRIRQDGTVEGEGFVGTACSLATAPIVEALGARIGDRLKPEFVMQQQRIAIGE